MLQFEEVKQSLTDLEPELRDLADALGLEKTKEEIEKLEQEAAAPGFWDHPENTQKVLQRTSGLKNKVESYEKLCRQFDDAMALAEMGDEAEDLSILPEAQEELEAFKSSLEAGDASLAGAFAVLLVSNGFYQCALGNPFQQALRGFLGHGGLEKPVVLGPVEHLPVNLGAIHGI